MKPAIAICALLCLFSFACNELRKETNDIVNFVKGKAHSAQVNGVNLKFYAEDSLKVDYVSESYSLSEEVADITLQGTDTNQANIRVGYWEYKPGDAKLSITPTGLSLTTKSGKPALLTKLEGTIPRSVMLSLSSTSGDIFVQDMADSKGLSLKGTSGDIELLDCHATGIEAKSVSGKLTLNRINSTGTVKLDSTSGSIKLDYSQAKELVAESVSGDVSVIASTIDKAECTTVSGNVDVTGSRIASKRYATTSGIVQEK